MREEREWSQGKLGKLSGKPRNVITRLEDPNYGKLTIKTLLEMASAFEVALLIKFVPFSRLLREYDDTSSSALGVPSISKESKRLKRWAQAEDGPPAHAPEAGGSQLSLQWDMPALDLSNFPRQSPAINPPGFSSSQGSTVQPTATGGNEAHHGKLRLVYSRSQAISQNIADSSSTPSGATYSQGIVNL
jgi:transcriptional regulator with XRE-family HTH domain